MSDEQGVDKSMISREDYDRMEQIHKNNLLNYVQAYGPKFW